MSMDEVGSVPAFTCAKPSRGPLGWKMHLREKAAEAESCSYYGEG